jgi:6-phosphogluconolactonase (cycloisomerase 2 family)
MILSLLSSSAYSVFAMSLAGPATPGHPQGRIFAMTNAAAGNGVAIYERDAQGNLTLESTVATGGSGSGADLGSQGGLVLGDDRKWLLAVNAGSDEVSVLGVSNAGVEMTQVRPSGGDMPLSVTIDGDLVYVLHGGSPNGVTGFRLSEDGELAAIPNSTRPLSGRDVQPAQIEFSPSGDFLVVTEKMTNRIDVFQVGSDGLLSDFHSLPSAGITPFGFAFRRGDQLVVSEAFMGAPDASAVSSYELESASSLATISPSVPTTETAACWIAIPKNQRFAYATNTGSDSISGYSIGPDGVLALLDADGLTARTGDNPVDMTFSNNGRFLYALNAHEGTISMYERHPDGSLESLGTPVGGLPASGAAGMTGY